MLVPSQGYYRDCKGNDAWSDAFATSNFVTLEATPKREST